MNALVFRKSYVGTSVSSAELRPLFECSTTMKRWIMLLTSQVFPSGVFKSWASTGLHLFAEQILFASNRALGQFRIGTHSAMLINVRDCMEPCHG